MTIATDLAFLNSMSSFVPKYCLNWQILVAVLNKFHKDGKTKVYIPVHLYGMALTSRTKVGMIRQNHNLIDRINFRSEAKQFTHKTMQKTTSCYIP